MLVVKIELWPRGDASRRRVIGRMTITNDGTASDGTGDSQFGNYNVNLGHSGIHADRFGSYRQGKVTNFRRSLSPYHLVARALSACKIK